MQVMAAFYIHSSGKDNKISLLYTFSGGKNRLFSNFFPVHPHFWALRNDPSPRNGHTEPSNKGFGYTNIEIKLHCATLCTQKKSKKRQKYREKCTRSPAATADDLVCFSPTSGSRRFFIASPTVEPPAIRTSSSHTTYRSGNRFGRPYSPDHSSGTCPSTSYRRRYTVSRRGRHPFSMC